MSKIPRVLLVGAGGIGHPAGAALLRAAELSLRIVEEDCVEISNMHRLPFADESSLGMRKGTVLEAHYQWLKAQNEACNPLAPELCFERFTPDNAFALLAGIDLVVEGSDNYPTRFLVADACGIAGIPVVHGAAVGWLGTVLPVRWKQSACYRCVFEDLPEGDTVDCASAGIYPAVATMIGALMAAEARRLLRGDDRFAGSVGSYDGLRQRFRSVVFPRRTDCPLCGTSVLRSLDPSRYIPPHCSSM